jgi:hypothetical protein
VATISKFANAHTIITTGYTNPTNAFDDDGTNATASPAKNTDVSAYFGFPAFTTGDIPDGSTINSVTVEVEFFVDITTSVAEQYVQAFVTTTGQGAEQSNTAEPTSPTVLSHTVTTITLSDLRTADVARCRSRSRRGNSSTAVQFSLDYARITVDYTAPVPDPFRADPSDAAADARKKPSYAPDQLASWSVSFDIPAEPFKQADSMAGDVTIRLGIDGVDQTQSWLMAFGPPPESPPAPPPLMGQGWM